jgi:DNA invertase Pin-like site-specific DNA recombinase
MIVGYARTSTTDQVAGLTDQIAQLEALGCERIWQEHASAVGDRPEFRAAVDYARAGDIFVVTRPDRLARSVIDMLTTINKLRAKGVEVRILSIGADTSTATGKLILTVLAGVAEMEREIMLERQRAGIAKAKAEGKYKGRKRVVDIPHAKILRAEGKSMREIARTLGCDASTICRALNPTA